MKSENTKNRTIVIAPAILGAAAGGLYARNHLSESRINKISQLEFKTPEFYEKIADCIDISKAAKEVKNGNINSNDYNQIATLKNKFLKFAQDERNVLHVVKTPLSERRTSYADAVKIANKSRLDAMKSALHVSSNFTKKLASLGVLDIVTWAQLNRAQGQKALKAIKIMLLPLSVGVALGGAVGALLGVGIRSLFNDGK